MIRNVTRASLVLVGLLLAAPSPMAAFQAPSPLELYQRGLVAEQSAGDLPEAIALYRRAAEESGNDRTLAARALVRAAGAYEKLASPESGALYAEVIRRYPEQTEWVGVAEARLVAVAAGATGQARGAGTRRTDVSATLDPVLGAYCVTCHNARQQTAGLALDQLDTADVSSNPDLWETILRRVRTGTMPPSQMPRPDAGTRQAVLSTLELALDQAYPSATGPAVSDAELATRMARFIWNAEPDTALVEAAGQGRLRDPEVLEGEVRRMMADPRSEALVSEFFERWLLPVGNLGTERYAAFDPELRQSMQQETRLFLADQVREDRPAMEIWTADYSFLDSRLAEHYGVDGVAGSQFRRVEMPNAARHGLFGHGTFLMSTSMGARTSPTARGTRIMRAFLGEVPPDPPPNVQPLTEDDRSVRARLDVHLVNPACSGCHGIFDPLGLALENFDALGRWRTTDQGTPIDASGSLVDGTLFVGPVELRAALAGYRSAFVTHAAESLLVHALGRNPAGKPYGYEMPSVRTIVREAAANDYRWASIVLGVVRSTPFQTEEVVP